jgi:hypothetical protein
MKSKAPPIQKTSDDGRASPEAVSHLTDPSKSQPLAMETYHESAESSNSQSRPYPPGASLRYLAAELERLAQELHRGEIPTHKELAVDENYQAGRLTGCQMKTETPVVLAGLVDSLRRIAKHRRAAVRSGSNDDLSPSVYPLVSSALEEVGQS